MKKINVYLQFPWKISDSQYYKSLLDNAPKNVEYISEKTKVGMITNKNKLTFLNFIKKSIRKPLEKSKLPILNIKKTKIKENYDLIHCAHCLSSNNVPWVADFESLWQMWISGRDTQIGRKKALKILKKDSCKKILAWTNTSKKEIEKRFPEIKNKISLVPYGMAFPKSKKIKHKKIRLLFIGRYFHQKGGLHALEAFDKLTKKYENVEALFISEVPKEILNIYIKNKKIKFSGLVPYNEIVNKIFPSSDIFVYPGYSDTFGFMFIEALAFGLPVITVDGFARKDIVTENKTGFIIKRDKNSKWYPSKEESKRIVENLVEKTSKLIENKKLMVKMSRNCKEVVKNGKFSLDNRNKKLEKEYRNAIK